MRKYINGEYSDMTDLEVEEMQANIPEVPEHEDSTQLDRIEQMLANIYSKLGLG